MVWWMMVGALAMAAPDGDADTDADADADTDADTDTDTGDVSVEDTVCLSPDDCSTATQLAGERGGNPCSDGSEGCDSSGGALPAALVIAGAGWAIRRRRELRPTRR